MYYTTHIFTVGNSQAIRIPKQLLKILGFKAGDEVILSTDSQNECIVIKKVVPSTYKSIKELFAGYVAGGYVPTEWDTGDLLGKENL